MSKRPLIFPLQSVTFNRDSGTFFLRVCVALQMLYYNQFILVWIHLLCSYDACPAPGFPFTAFSPSRPSLRFKQLTSLSLNALASQRFGFKLITTFVLDTSASTLVHIRVFIIVIKRGPTKCTSTNNIFIVTISSTCTRFEPEDLLCVYCCSYFRCRTAG